MNLDKSYNQLIRAVYDKSINIDDIPFSTEEFLKRPDAEEKVMRILESMESENLIKFDTKYDLFSIENMYNFLKNHNYNRISEKQEKIKYLSHKFKKEDILGLFKEEIKDNVPYNSSLLYECYKNTVLTDFLLENKEFIKENYTLKFLHEINLHFLYNDPNSNGARYFTVNNYEKEFITNFIRQDEIFDFLNTEYISDFMNINEYHRFPNEIYSALENKLGRDVIIEYFIKNKNEKSFKNSDLFLAIRFSVFGAFLKEIENEKIILTEEDKLLIKTEALNSRNTYRENFEKILSFYDSEDPLYSEFIKTLTMPNPVKNLKIFIKNNEKELPKIWEIIKNKENDYIYPDFSSRKSKKNMALNVSPIATILNSRTTTEAVFLLIQNGYPLLEKEKNYLPYIIMNNFNYYHEESTNYLVDLSKKNKEYINVESLLTFISHKKAKEDVLLIKVIDILSESFDFKEIKLDFSKEQKKSLCDILDKNEENMVYLYTIFDDILKRENHNLDIQEMNFANYLLLPYLYETNKNTRSSNPNNYSGLTISEELIDYFKISLSKEDTIKLKNKVKEYNEKGIFKETDIPTSDKEEIICLLKNIILKRKNEIYMERYVDFVKTMIDKNIITPVNILLSNEYLTILLSKRYLNYTTVDLKDSLKYYPIFDGNYALFLENNMKKKYPDLFVTQNTETPRKRI